MTLTQIKPAGLSKPVDLADNEKIRLGTGNDLQIFHSGTHSFVENSTGILAIRSDSFQITDKSNNHAMITAAQDGAVELYYDNAKRIETTTYGVTVSGGGPNNPTTDAWDTNTSIITSGSYGGGIAMIDGSRGFVQYCHGAGVNYELKNAATNSTPETNLKAIANGAVELYYDNVKKLNTEAGGITVAGTIWTDAVQLNDNEKYYAGTSQDLQIYHDGSNSYLKHISSGTGDLLIFADGHETEFINVSGEHSAKMKPNGAVELYYDNSKKLETSSIGVTVTGGVYPAATDTYQLGGSSLRWNELNIKSVIDVSDNGKIRMGDSDDLQIYHDSSSGGKNYIESPSTDFAIRVASGNRLEINGTSGDVVMQGSSGRNFLWDNSEAILNLNDNAKLTFGTGNDLQIYHDGSHSYINETGAGQLYIRGGASTVCSLQNTLSHDIYLQFSHSDHNNNYIGFEDDHFVVYTKNSGASTHSVRINVDHAGLAFHGDTAAANRLNDYEEGTWTGGFNDFNGTYTANTGLYTKIGNLVTVSIMLSGSGGSGSGNLILTSLPFSSEGTPSTYRAAGTFHAHQGVVTGGLQVIGLMNNNSNQVNIRGINNNATMTNLNRNGLNSSGWEVVITITYQTAS